MKTKDKQTILNNSYLLEIKDLNKTIQNMAEYIIERNDNSVICKDTGCSVLGVNMNCTCKQCIINHFTQQDKMGKEI